MLILPLASSLAFHASPLGCTRSSHSSDHARTSSLRAAHWMDVLKFGGTTPPFDVIQKTQEFVGSRAERAEEFFADDYVFRGSIIGPMSNAEVRETQKVRRSSQKNSLLLLSSCARLHHLWRVLARALKLWLSYSL